MTRVEGFLFTLRREDGSTFTARLHGCGGQYGGGSLAMLNSGHGKRTPEEVAAIVLRDAQAAFEKTGMSNVWFPDRDEPGDRMALLPVEPIACTPIYWPRVRPGGAS